MTQRNPIAPGQGANPRVTELHRLARQDYVKGQQQRATPRLAPSYAAASVALAVPATEPSDLDVAISVAQQILGSDQILSLREALRLLLRALGAEPAGGHQERLDGVAPVDLPRPVTDLFAALAEALDVPLASTDPSDERAYHRLVERRSLNVRILLESLASHPDVPIDRDAADVRRHIEQTPVTYTTFEAQKAKDAQRGEGQ